MRSVEVVKALPFVQFRFEIGIAFVAEETVKLLAARAVRSLDLTVELGRAALDIGVADTQILDMPMELRLEPVAIVSPNFSDAAWEHFL